MIQTFKHKGLKRFFDKGDCQNLTKVMLKKLELSYFYYKEQRL